MKTKTINIYQFDELKPEIQKKVMDRFRENNDCPFLKDQLQEQLIDILKINKITYNDYPKMYYSLSYCQVLVLLLCPLSSFF